ncbi:MAG: ATP-binding cassette domain-containing protein [Pirellulales bacterium]|nr:ATP-binding cassette domain-containing protein [Pirellulales bacterium]
MTLLELSGITKYFGEFAALTDVSFALRGGEVLAIVGENGAGKSTLINILSGILQPDAGMISLDGRELHLPNPVSARQSGLIAVHQETEVFSPLTLAENLALSIGLPTSLWGLVDWNRIGNDACSAVAALHEPVDPRTPAGRLQLAQRQMARIAVAIQHGARVLLLDEPTSSLSESEARWLFGHVRALRDRGVGIIYISHRQAEVFELSDRVMVLRDGKMVWQGATGSMDAAGLIRAMVGRDAAPVQERLPHCSAPGPALFQAHQLTDSAGRFSEVDLVARAGEVVGVYGLVGAGRSEFAQAVVGLRQAENGSVYVDGQPIRVGSAAAAMRAGIAYVPEDRRSEGLFADLSVRDNTVMATLDRLGHGPLTNETREKQVTQAQITALSIRCRSTEQPVRELSGGNQQKTVLSRWLLSQPRVMLLDEPTRGVDVGAKTEIHQLLRSWADGGRAVVLISSDLPEVLENSDRIIVFREGRVAGELTAAEATADRVAAMAMPAESSQRAKAARAPSRRLLPSSEWGLLAATAGLVAGLAVTTPNFLSSGNLSAVGASTAVWAILALAASLVIVAGAIDISIGAIFALGAAVAAMTMKSSLPDFVSIPLGIGMGLAAGMAAGLLNAGLALAGRVHPIVVTLAMMTALRGGLIMLTGGDALTDLPRQFDQLATYRWGAVNSSILLMLCVMAFAQFIQNRTTWGRFLYAYGANPLAARTVGISQKLVWSLAFGAGGLLAALAGILELAQTGAMQSSMGTGYEMRAIAAAVIGGAAITGGRGSAFGVLLGALLISLVHNSLVLWQVSRYHSDLVIGGLILAAVVWDLLWRLLDERLSRRGA